MAFTQRVRIHVIISNTRTHIYPSIPVQVNYFGPQTNLGLNITFTMLNFALRNCPVRTPTRFLHDFRKMGKQLDFKVLKIIKKKSKQTMQQFIGNNKNVNNHRLVRQTIKWHWMGLCTAFHENHKYDQTIEIPIASLHFSCMSPIVLHSFWRETSIYFVWKWMAILLEISFDISCSSSSFFNSRIKNECDKIVCKTWFHSVQSKMREKHTKKRAQKWWNGRMWIEYGYIEIRRGKNVLFLHWNVFCITRWIKKKTITAARAAADRCKNWTGK